MYIIISNTEQGDWSVKLYTVTAPHALMAIQQNILSTPSKQ